MSVIHDYNQNHNRTLTRTITKKCIGLSLDACSISLVLSSAPLRAKDRTFKVIFSPFPLVP